MQGHKHTHGLQEDIEKNKNRQGVDRDPQEEKQKGEQVSPANQKGKKVDGDPTQRKDQPANLKDKPADED
jgi:hypothetical protein